MKMISFVLCMLCASQAFAGDTVTIQKHRHRVRPNRRVHQQTRTVEYSKSTVSAERCSCGCNRVGCTCGK